jgi:uncharacterized membrane protein
VTFANPLPWWALFGAVAAAALVAWYAYAGAPLTSPRRYTLSALRFISLLGLLLLVMRPVAGGHPDDASDAIVPILVDTSRSMGIEDASGKRRIDHARDLLKSDLMPAISKRFQTEILAFGEDLTVAPADALGATARRSELAAALDAVRERHRGRPVAGIVLLSDGGETSAATVHDDSAEPIPVFAVGIGAPVIGRDREVLSVTAAEAVLDDSRVELAVTAVSHGFDRSPIEIRLLENGRPVELRRVTAAADGTPISTAFSVSPARGAATLYTIEIPAEVGELVPENNTRSVLVQPPSRTRRVLLVQGAPGFEHSFLRRAWSGDSGLEIDAVVRKGKNEQGSDTFYIQAASSRGAALVAGYPTRVEDLFAYDAIAFANMEGAALTTAQLEATRDFVGRRGGGLLVLGAQSFLRRGLRDTPLEELVPLDLGERGLAVLQASAGALRAANRVALTAAGEAHPIMQLSAALDETRKRWEAVPALASISPLGGPRPGATVLAVTSGPGGTPRALVAVQRYGEGRSMVFAGEASWRWRMLLPADDRSYDTFWRQAIRWLALPAPDPVAVSVPAGSAPGDIVPLRVAARTAAFEPLRDATVDVRVTKPDGRVESLPAAMDIAAADGTFLAKVLAEEPGVYRVTAEVRRPGAAPVMSTTSMLVGGADPEMTDPRLDSRLLERVAAASGGRVIEEGRTADLVTDLRAGLPAAALRVRRDLWHTGWSFAAIVTLLAGEWLMRRRWGLR